MAYRNVLENCKKCFYVIPKLTSSKYSKSSQYRFGCKRNFDCEFKFDLNWKNKNFNKKEIISQSLNNDNETEEKRKMVKRKKAEFTPIKEFDGLVESVTIETNDFEEGSRQQYHMVFKPLDKEAKEAVKDSKTERLHNYLSISNTTTDTEVAEGSNLDKYLQDVEMLLSETEEMQTHQEVMNFLVNKKFHFKRKRIGKSYGGHEARELFVPVKVIK